MAVNHILRAKQAYPYLRRRAKSGGAPFTYGEIAAKLGLHHRSARWFLGVIQRYCGENNFPPLQALVINKKKKLPGKGYRGSARTVAAHKKAIKAVREFDWPKRTPKF